jgi:hypothetical protein
VQMGDLPNGEQGILATANRRGTPKPAADLRPDDRIVIEGFETTVANATRLGYLSRDPSGTYRDNSANLAAAEATQQAAAEQARQEAAADPHYGQPLDQPATEALSELVHGTTAGSQTRALLDVVDKGEISMNTLAALASEASVEPGEIAAKAQAVMQGFRQQAASLAQSHGADADDFFAWAQEHQAGAFKQAMLQHGQQRSTAGYVGLLRSYMENLSSRPGGSEVILNARFPDAGVSAYKNQSGEIVLRTPNGEVSWRVAVRTGLVKPQRG